MPPPAAGAVDGFEELDAAGDALVAGPGDGFFPKSELNTEGAGVADGVGDGTGEAAAAIFDFRCFCAGVADTAEVPAEVAADADAAGVADGAAATFLWPLFTAEGVGVGVVCAVTKTGAMAKAARANSNLGFMGRRLGVGLGRGQSSFGVSSPPRILDQPLLLEQLRRVRATRVTNERLELKGSYLGRLKSKMANGPETDSIVFYG